MFVAGMATSVCGAQATADYNVAPQPRKIQLLSGAPASVTASTVIVCTKGDQTLLRTASFLAQYIEEATGLKLKITDKQQKSNSITLRVQSGEPESYTLTVGPKSVVIAGADQAGVFYGVQTLRKSISAATKGNTLLLPQVVVTDAPRFGYRGAHLDVSRHFFTPGEVKRFVDMLALHNINRFHWHLTDDQGWRIEIKKYPKLTTLGSVRTREQIGVDINGERERVFIDKSHGGFYTQDDIREVVAYAAERFVTVIPEIEMPGHARAALAAFPELSCCGGPFRVEGEWGVLEDIFCTREEVFTFLENILTEVVGLFPSKYIHIGGDEAPKLRWSRCHACQERIKALGLKDEHELQSWFVTRMEKFLATKGKRIIGWDEILEGGLAPDATVMSWRGVEGGVEAARLGHDAIMTPTDYMYFDYYQSENRVEEPVAIGGYVPLEKVYSYEPCPEELTAEQRRHIIGVQANLWTEYIADYPHVEYMSLPRMAALCELQWCGPEQKNYGEFLKRLQRLTAIYDLSGYNYRRHVAEAK